MAKTILIVEDEVPIAKVLEKKLELAGYTVTVAGDGQQALTLLATTSYDLVLLDLLMPEVDGWEVLTQLKGKGQRVVVTSNLGQQEDIVKATSLGALDFLVKSNTPLSEIVSKVAAYTK
jgi:DNA-binding response OmpR family regulator